MNFLHLKYAIEVAKTQSISKAADNLYMGQPNLSRAIKELEESLGITIFKRISKGIVTTPDGDDFLRRARSIVAQVEEVEEIYRNKRSHRQKFSICAPQSGYIAAAMAETAKNIVPGEPAEFIYKEDNSNEVIPSVARGDYSLGIVRYRAEFEKYFADMFKEKKLIYETVAEFSYLMLISRNNPLAGNENITSNDIKDFIEITHHDPYIPSMALTDIKKTELSENTDKRIYVFERASQLELLAEVPKTFMWVPPVPRRTLDKYGLVTREFPGKTKTHKDVLIYRKDYKLTDIDKTFITELCNSKHDCF